MKKKLRIIALIPARSGSKRIKNKNIYPLNGHPLIAFPIISAIKSRIFSKIIVSTNNSYYKKIAEYYGADVPFLRPKKYSGSKSSDYEWVKFTLDNLKDKFDVFVILRPTSPFRNELSIKKSIKFFFKHKMRYSLRAISLTKNHPGKMWFKKDNFILPVFKGSVRKQPFYNSQFASLPKIYQQNGSMEISRTDVIKKFKTITTKKIIPYFSTDWEGFDINYQEDLQNINKTYYKKLTKILKKSYLKK